MTRREAAESFLKLAGTGRVDEAYERFIAPEFTHHNQYFPGDRESLKTAMARAHEHSPNERVDVKRVLEDGDFVVTLSHVVGSGADASSVAVVHIFRFEGDHVVELWDLGQALNPDSPNENGPF